MERPKNKEEKKSDTLNEKPLVQKRPDMRGDLISTFPLHKMATARKEMEFGIR